MGLDMYLSVKRHSNFSKWDQEDGKQKSFNYPPELKKIEDKLFNHNFLTNDEEYGVGYWRKFNALHDYMVNVVGSGEDDGSTIYVSDKECQQILDICKKIQKNHELAPSLLPTVDGFFFGSTEYDDWYFKNIDYTVDLFTDLIEFLHTDAGRQFTVQYDASW